MARTQKCPQSTSRPLQPIRKDLVIRFRRQRLAREAIMAAKEISVKKYVVRLSGEERERLETLIRKGKSLARRVLKARILLKADVSEAGKGWSDNRIIEALETSPYFVRIRRKCASPKTTTWSTHSRRIDPISLSAKPFCQGEPGAMGLSRRPMARNRCVTAMP